MQSVKVPAHYHDCCTSLPFLFSFLCLLLVFFFRYWNMKPFYGKSEKRIEYSLVFRYTANNSSSLLHHPLCRRNKNQAQFVRNMWKNETIPGYPARSSSNIGQHAAVRQTNHHNHLRKRSILFWKNLLTSQWQTVPMTIYLKKS